MKPTDVYAIDALSHKLQNRGIRVVTVSIEREFTDGNSIDTSGNISRQTREYATWELEVSHQKVAQIAGMDDAIDQLATTLNNNPTVKEQWEEMMVMLKLLGFDKDLLKND